MKRVFAILLSALMLMAIMPMSFAQNAEMTKAQNNTVPKSGNKAVIDKIEIQNADITPIAGVFAGYILEYTLPSGANYTCTKHDWYDEGNHVYVPESEQFVRGNYYSLLWEITAASGYSFDENTAVTVNGGNLAVDTTYTRVSPENNTVFFVWTKPLVAGDLLQNVNIANANLTPVVGDKTGDHLGCVIPDGADYTCVNNYWLDEATAERLDKDDVFVEGHTYAQCFDFKAAEGMYFYNGINVTINGLADNVDIIALNGQDHTQLWVWTNSTLAQPATTDKVISNITINGADITPVIDESAGNYLNYTLISGVNYTCTKHYWRNETESTILNDDEFFIEGNMYSMCWVIEAASGYVFDENASVTLNGGALAVDTEYTGIGSEDGTEFYVWTKPVVAGYIMPSVMIEAEGLTPVVGDKTGDHIIYRILDPDSTCEDSYWYDDTTHEHLGKDDIFEAGHKYSLCFVMRAAEGWYFFDSTMIKINDSTDDFSFKRVNPQDHTQMYVWTKTVEAVEPGEQKHTVTFVDGVTGETISTLTVEHGKDAELPTAPEHEGYIFKGWDSDGKNIVADTTITAQYLLLGDTNFDGTVNTGDAVMILRSCVGLVELSDDQKLAADMSGDGKINTGDAVAVLRFYVGLKDA